MVAEILDLRRLRAFSLVAQLGSIQAAATQLKLTVPAVSTQIRHLEQELGVQLFERLPNRLLLTETGQRFAGEASAVLERAQQAVATLAPETELRGQLAVSIVGDHLWYFAPRIANFLTNHPDVELSLRVYQTNYALGALIAGEIDLCVGIYTQIPARLERHILAETSICLICPRDHPLAQRAEPSLKDIGRYRLITLPRYAESRAWIDAGFARSGVKLDQVLEVASCQTAKTFVERGVGVAVIHSRCMGDDPASNLCAIDLGMYLGKIKFSSICRRGSAKSPLIRKLLASLSA